MRPTGWVLAMGLLVGCQVTVPLAPGTGGEQRARAGLPLTVIRGAVTGPASLIGVDAGGLIGPDGNGLVGLDAGALVGVDAGSLRWAGRTLLQGGQAPLARTVVLLAGPDGVPLVPRVQAVTDASGRYTLQTRGRAGVVLALARTPERQLVRLSGLLHESASGQVGVSTATTLVTTALMAEVRGTGRGFAGLRAVDYQAAVDGVATAAAAVSPATLAAPAAVLAAAREAIGASEGTGGAFARLVARLAPTAYGVEPSALPSPPLVTPGPTPEVPASPELVAATAVAPGGARPVPTPASFIVPGRPPQGPCIAPFKTDIVLAADERLTLTASGTIQVGPEAETGPRGLATRAPAQARCQLLLPDLPWGALLARVGDDGAWMLVGERLTVTGQEGPLYLTVNDGEGGDNGGELHVTMAVEPL
ncbi:MAG: hypothetical protein VKQ33_00440 [Candidatus Sericytochromatia bacterium]|nr:hypothetical protein [Candidatus Sericytochromatia bacterium]